MGPAEFLQLERDQAKAAAMRPADYIAQGLARSVPAQWRPAVSAAPAGPPPLSGPVGSGIDGNRVFQLRPGMNASDGRS